MADRAPRSGKLRFQRNSAVLRVASALVLAPLAIGAAWIGGLPFSLFWGLAAFGIWWEWSILVAVSAARLVMFTGIGALGLALALSATGRYLASIIVLILGAVATNVVAPAGRGIWVGLGLIYAGSLLVAPLVIRHGGNSGFVAIILIFGVVWATDILAYYGGRMVGGPKLWPRVSPSKTWAGAIAGACGAIVVALAFAYGTAGASAVHLALLGFGLSLAAQGGDLIESAIKRRFGVKDSSRIIPGHGGLMDRLDGFIVAAAIAAAYGIVRTGLDNAAQGLLRW